MTNILDGDKVYNIELKEEFLMTYDNEQTRTTVSYVFYASKEYEEDLNKDLYDFTLDEIGGVIYNLNPMTSSTASSYGRFTSAYINFCIGKGLRQSNINPLSIIQADWYDQFIDKSKKLYLSEKEIVELEDDLENAQDKALIRCVFEGIAGHDLSELYNLKLSDVDWNKNVVHLKDDRYGERDVEVSERCLRFIRWANEQTEYQKANGNSTSRSPIMPLVESDYVFKNSKTNVEKENEPVDKHTFYRKLTQISKWFNVPILTIKSLQKSGMIYKAVQLHKNEEELTNKQLTKIAEQFGLRKMKQNGYEMYNYFVIRQTVNPENIKELYDIDIEE